MGVSSGSSGVGSSVAGSEIVVTSSLFEIIGLGSGSEIVDVDGSEFVGVEV